LICIYCNKEVIDDLFYLGIDIPYINLKVHKGCWKANKDGGFLRENKEKILNYINILNELSNKQTKSKK
jgi:hypothetical protein